MSCDVTFGRSEQKVMKSITKCYIQIMSYVHENVLLHISLGDILTYYKVCFIVSLYIFMIFDELPNGILVSYLITCCGKEEHHTMVVKVQSKVIPTCTLLIPKCNYC
jgi:hypothetical protein